MRKRRRTILVVDDEHDVLEMIELGLGLDGYRVLSAETGEQAIEAVARHQVDLVISDLRMPGMGGIETIARLREIAPHVPVIVVTGYPAPGALSTSRCPACAATASRASDRPSPVPCPSGLVVKNGSKIRASASAAM